MHRLRSFFVTLLYTVHLVSISSGEELQCTGSSWESQQISLSVNSIRSKDGKWETSFLAHQNTSDLPNNIDVNVKRNYTKCQGNHVIQIRGFLKDMSQEQNNMKLTFKRCSKNAAITNNGRTLQKLDISNGFGSGFTSRTVMDDEIFTVRIDAKDGKFNHAMGIGLSLLNPDSQDLQDHSWYYKSGTWMFYHHHLYQNGTIVYNNFLKTNLKDVEVGHTVGVMRSAYGTLHLFIDGVDQGPAASNIPKDVYGIFELYGNVIKGTIVDA